MHGKFWQKFTLKKPKTNKVYVVKYDKSNPKQRRGLEDGSTFIDEKNKVKKV